MTSNANASSARLLVDTLIAGGVGEFVVSPGSRSTPLVLAVAAAEARGDARVHVVLDERAAGFLALGLGRASHRPAVLICTSGSAGAHYLPAVIEASASRVPLLALTADRPSELHHCGAPQTVEQRGFFAGHTRWFVNLEAPRHSAHRHLASIAARAVAASIGSPAGPVHINASFRKPLWERSETAATSAVARVAVGRTVPDEAALQSVAERINAAPHGLVVVGPRPVPPTDERITALDAAVSALSAQLGWPVLADPASNVRFRGTGAVANGLKIDTYDALLQATSDLPAGLVLRLGQAPTSKLLNGWLAERASGGTVLLEEDGQWLDPDQTADTLIAGDVVAALVRLTALTVSRPSQTSWSTANAAIQPVLDAAVARPDWEGAVARRVVQALPDGAALHLGSSMPMRDVDRFCPGTGANLTVFASRGANGIDGNVATAAGEALASGRPTCLLLGDLALQHDLSGLLTAAGMGVRLTVVVVDNKGGGIFARLPIAEHPTAFERYFVTPQTVDLPALCRAAGTRFLDVETEDLADAVRADLEHEGVGVLRVVIDCATNLWRQRSLMANLLDTL
jgi:2-succinyl-5-enolpyruvyl-6-hydroxy-3-cyclohexene-1-carboxylate synthase